MIWKAVGGIDASEGDVVGLGGLLDSVDVGVGGN
jgi:hypothetical protein